MPARIKMVVTLEPVEVWVELPDYVDEGIGKASEDAAWMLKDQFASVTVTLPGDSSAVTCPSSVTGAETSSDREYFTIDQRETTRLMSGSSRRSPARDAGTARRSAATSSSTENETQAVRGQDHRGQAPRWPLDNTMVVFDDSISTVRQA